MTKQENHKQAINVIITTNKALGNKYTKRTDIVTVLGDLFPGDFPLVENANGTETRFMKSLSGILTEMYGENYKKVEIRPKHTRSVVVH